MNTAQILSNVAIAVITALTTLLAAKMAQKHKDKEAENSMSAIAAEAIKGALSSKALEIGELKKEIEKQSRNIRRVNARFTRLSVRISKLRSCFESVDHHLKNYLELSEKSHKQASDYLPFVESDMSKLRAAFDGLVEASEPFDGEGDEGDEGEDDGLLMM